MPGRPFPFPVLLGYLALSQPPVKLLFLKVHSTPRSHLKRNKVFTTKTSCWLVYCLPTHPPTHKKCEEKKSVAKRGPRLPLCGLVGSKQGAPFDPLEPQILSNVNLGRFPQGLRHLNSLRAFWGGRGAQKNAHNRLHAVPVFHHAVLDGSGQLEHGPRGVFPPNTGRGGGLWPHLWARFCFFQGPVRSALENMKGDAI